MPPALFGCWVYRLAMQIYQPYQFHAVSFACIIQEDLKVPVLCVVAFSTPNKIYQQKPYLCLYHSLASNFEKGLLPTELMEEPLMKPFCKPNLFTVQLHQHFGLNLTKWIISDHMWLILLWLISLFFKDFYKFHLLPAQSCEYCHYFGFAFDDILCDTGTLRWPRSTTPALKSCAHNL